MALNLFWASLFGLILLLVYGDWEVGIRSSTILILGFIGFAVWAILGRLERIRRQIQEPKFHLKSEKSKELWQSVGFVFSVIVLLIIGITVQGSYRCIESGEELTLECIWNGTMTQIADDLPFQSAIPASRPSQIP